ncbi:YggS family pyridoxal phosphate-dependent enzyme [Providencia alcalifaciens]|uniref:Pyridoxal phosphate homeostasis protein n=1 Tax=Providencia alcalifaciens 205/92 TaxID=1256988 RepID=A0AAV3M4N2_9GAMM|nr:YggS family pyridoxal phosphate-dependent enzyme [Providencia alcalifaciens]EUD06769.1 pyridoxal phosphate enzyme, YggS family [Providencia alcalifaciens R90-1475]EUD10499.1 pyridoxal phosphate enzyme, YggS family [Providencia alcalifaciens 205/92]MTC15585.1 YggS family pyridoxal phosphate-dependent enzyme [Providencia alcalifaciens]MTC63772.1 YggS family pyridoxal phosphate-dependent enzyme [Providencia alcalifaciens]WGZ52907.1 YggS family pyridoxal phosphate-dependent enzyme [Providencia 
MTIQKNLSDVTERIRLAATECHRSPQDITLLAVSKTKPCEAIMEAIEAGQRQFGENYVQEGVEKIQYFSERNDLVWHFIGPLQSNKSRLVAEHFDWFHTLDRAKIAQRLNEQRPQDKAPLNVLIQINISDENSKSGITLEEVNELAAQVAQLPNLVLRGLMTIPAPETDYEHQCAAFRQMEYAFEQLKASYSTVDTLSMGMTDDMRAAIHCGSTLVRIGTAIFGARQYHN